MLLISKKNKPYLSPFSNEDGLCDVASTVGSYVFTGCRGDGGVTVFEGDTNVSDYFLWGTYTAPPFSLGEYASQIHSLKWQVEGDGEVLLRVRSANSEEALQQAQWHGPDGKTTSFFTDASGQSLSLDESSEGTFVQWKAYFKKTGNDTPILKNVILSFE